MKNHEISELLMKIADLLELQNENRFKLIAYRNAAMSIENLSEDILDIYKKNKLEEIPAIGKGIAEKIEEFLETGKSEYLEKLKEKTPIEESLMHLEGLGPKRLNLLYKKLNIKTIKDLEYAAKHRKIRKLIGFGEKAEQNILKSIELSAEQKRFPLGLVWKDIKELENKIKNISNVERVEICGSARRMKETIGDLDILAISNKPILVMDSFIKLPEVKRILAKGETKSTVILKNNMQVDLRVLPKESFGAAMQYFTGNQNHNIKLRKIAISKNYKLSEYGLFKGNNIVKAKDEISIYRLLGLEYIEPELREDTGEIEAAQNNKLPDLVQISDIKADCHMHTTETDGTNIMEEMIEAAIKLKREYIVFTDHTKGLRFINGMDEKRILKQIEKIKKMNKIYGSRITILSGVELNIMDSGEPDIENRVLKKLDVVIASVHSGFKEPIDKINKRVIKAMENPNIDIIGHPTGRLINKREPFQIDIDLILDKARETNTCMEINSYYDRLDLKDIHIRKAVKKNVKLIINTDSHHTSHLDFMKFGVAQARRGWAEKNNILNTLELDKFLQKLK